VDLELGNVWSVRIVVGFEILELSNNRADSAIIIKNRALEIILESDTQAAPDGGRVLRPAELADGEYGTIWARQVINAWHRGGED